MRNKRAATRELLDELATCGEDLAGIRNGALLRFAFGSSSPPAAACRSALATRARP